MEICFLQTVLPSASLDLHLQVVRGSVPNSEIVGAVHDNQERQVTPQFANTRSRRGIDLQCH